MNATAWKEKSIGEIVAEDFRSASLFKEAGIDFCCGGKKSLNEACAEVQVDVLPFIARLEALTLTEPGHSVNFKEWDLDFLADYIVQNHHKFVLKQLPDLLVYTQKRSLRSTVRITPSCWRWQTYFAILTRSCVSICATKRRSCFRQ